VYYVFDVVSVRSTDPCKEPWIRRQDPHLPGGKDLTLSYTTPVDSNLTGYMRKLWEPMGTFLYFGEGTFRCPGPTKT
jgi:hypothetical protein